MSSQLNLNLAIVQQQQSSNNTGPASGAQISALGVQTLSAQQANLNLALAQQQHNSNNGAPPLQQGNQISSQQNALNHQIASYQDLLSRNLNS